MDADVLDLRFWTRAVAESSANKASDRGPEESRFAQHAIEAVCKSGCYSNRMSRISNDKVPAGT